MWLDLCCETDDVMQLESGKTPALSSKLPEKLVAVVEQCLVHDADARPDFFWLRAELAVRRTAGSLPVCFCFFLRFYLLVIFISLMSYSCAGSSGGASISRTRARWLPLVVVICLHVL